MSETMIERVARAIAVTDGWQHLSQMHRLQRDVYIVRARAAIEAMRPTPEDIVAMVEMLMASPSKDGHSNEKALNCYIDAALK